MQLIKLNLSDFRAAQDLLRKQTKTRKNDYSECLEYQIPVTRVIPVTRKTIHLVFIPVTRSVKGYTRFVGKYVVGRRILLIRITSGIDLAMSKLQYWDMTCRFQRRYRESKESSEYHAHSNSHKHPQICGY